MTMYSLGSSDGDEAGVFSDTSSPTSDGGTPYREPATDARVKHPNTPVRRLKKRAKELSPSSFPPSGGRGALGPLALSEPGGKRSGRAGIHNPQDQRFRGRQLERPPQHKDGNS